MSQPRIGLIWAQNEDGIIGDGRQMLWHLPEELAFFKRTTLGSPVIMGRNTWEAMPAKVRPLPGRTNIVVSRTSTDFPGALSATSVEEAIAKASELIDDHLDDAPASAAQPTIWVIGGGQIYEAAMPLANQLAVTFVEKPLDIAGAVHAPEIGKQWRCVEERRTQVSEPSGTAYRVTFWERA